MSNPKKWWEVYSDDKEKQFFVGADGQSGLCRKAGFDWRTVDRLSIEGKLTKVEVEDIIQKYVKSGIIIQHKTDPEKWGYWERVGTNPAPRNVADEDKKSRVEKAKQASKT